MLETKARSVGFRATLFLTDRGLFAADATGVSGPLAEPGERVAFAALVGRADEVWLLTESGRSFRAASVQAALDGRYQPGPALADATAVDASEDVVAVATGDRVHISTDRGLTFQAHTPKRRQLVTQVLARRDAVVVAVTKGPQGAEETWIKPAKRPFTRSSYQPSELRRSGSLIYTRTRCDAALGEDGRTWYAPRWHKRPGAPPPPPTSNDLEDLDISCVGCTEPVPEPEPFGLAQFDELELGLSRELRLRPQPNPTTPIHPLAPDSIPARKRAVGPEVTCNDPQLSSVFGTLPSSGAEPCQGARCLINARVPARGSDRVMSFTDGYCRRITSQTEPFGQRRCKDHASPMRPPTLALIDPQSGAVRALRPPSLCPFRALLADRGLAWLPCEDAQGTRLVGVSPSGALTQEGVLPVAVGAGQLVVGGDGTAVLRTEAGRYFARAPGALGGGSRFRPLARDIVFALPWERGGTLSVLAGSDDRSLRIGLENEQGFQPLGAPVSVGAGNVIALEVDGDGRVILSTHPTMRSNHDTLSMLAALSSAKIERHVVMNDGSLEPAPQRAR